MTDVQTPPAGKSERAVGMPFSRVDGSLKVTGHARYTAEMPLDNLVYAALADSTIANGHITGVDTRAAEAAPGVLAVITHLNAPKLNPAPVAISNQTGSQGSAGEQLVPLQNDIVYHSGQHLAIVIADTLEHATYAASLVKFQYDAKPPVVVMEEVLGQTFAPMKVWGSPPDTEQGSMARGWSEGEVKVDQTYITALQNHVTMEPHATVAAWDGDRLTLYEPTTWVYGARTTVAAWLGIPQEKIRVLQHYVGGSFGCKGPVWTHVVLAAIAARQVGRPVKLVLTRAQTFTSVGRRPRIHHDIRLAATREGKLTAVEHGAIAETSPYDDRVVAAVTKTTRKLYACPNIKTTYRLVHLNLNGPFTMRGPGETPGLFAVESALDELAYALKMDPVELRLRNYAEVDPETGKPWSSKSLRECYRQAATRFGWSRRTPEPRSMRDGGLLVGWGMATMAYDARTQKTSALARLHQDGTVLVESATCDQGTGSYTIMRQIAADTLGVPFGQIQFDLGDTAMPFAPISAGSMTTSSVGSAVQAACTALKRKILDLARANTDSPLYNQPEEAIGMENGRMFLKVDPAIGEAYGDFLKRLHLDRLEASADIAPGEEEQKFTMYSFGAHFAEVKVNPDSGETWVTRYTAGFGAGRIINPKTARSQLIGGIVWGIGMALMEETHVDPHLGRVVNADLAEYHVPVNPDIPEMDVFFVEESDPHVNPIGVKGIGEIGTIGAAAAIANAVYHATGKRIRELPITPDKVL